MEERPEAPGRVFLQASSDWQEAGCPLESAGTLGTCPHILTVSRHAQSQALLQAAVLAPVSTGAVDGAVLLTGAGVGHITLLAAAEEALGSRDCLSHPGHAQGALVPGLSTSGTPPTPPPQPPLHNCDRPCGHFPTPRQGPPPACS